MKLFSLAVSTILATGAVIAAPSSAVLVDANGSVLVNQGKQFVSAKSGQLLIAGDRVMVMEGSNASVRYADGCVLKLNSGSLATISMQSSCVTGQANTVAQIAPLYANDVDAKNVAVNDDDNDCDDDGIADSLDDDVDGDGVLNADDDFNACNKAVGLFAAAPAAAGIGVGLGIGAAAIGALALFNYEQNRTVSP